MALYWNEGYTQQKMKKTCWNKISKKDYEKVASMMLPTSKYKDGRNHYVLDHRTSVLIWYMGMQIGMHSITKENYEKVYDRINRLEKQNNSLLFNNEKPYFITLEDVKNHIGLEAQCERKSFHTGLFGREWTDNEFTNQLKKWEDEKSN